MIKKFTSVATFFIVVALLFTAACGAGSGSVSAQITSFTPASGAYYPGDQAVSSLSFKNTGKRKWTFWIGYSVRDGAGRWHDVPSRSVSLNPGQESRDQAMIWRVPEDALLTTGNYMVVMSVWKTKPESSKSPARLDRAEQPDAFSVFNFRDDFNSFDTNRWSKPAKNLGRGRLYPENVGASNGNLEIKIPANTYDGGEIESNSLYKYGTYRARMKLPNAPGSITGFFLYRSPDYFNEIDIEIYNDNSRRILFTTYAGGAQTNSETMRLDFDPTTGFHEYRFDFYPGSVNFFVDGKLLKSWSNGLPPDSMKLLVNAWFPNWLSGSKPTSDRYVYVDWIQH